MYQLGGKGFKCNASAVPCEAEAAGRGDGRFDVPPLDLAGMGFFLWALLDLVNSARTEGMARRTRGGPAAAAPHPKRPLAHVPRGHPKTAPTDGAMRAEAVVAARQRGRTIGIVVPDLDHPFFVELVRCIERAAAAAGYASLLVEARYESSEIEARIQRLTAHPVIGVISAVYSPAVWKLDLPVVTIGRAVAGRDAAGPDDDAGAAIVADHLVATGHRRIGIVGSPMPGGEAIRREPLLKAFAGRVTIAWEMTTPPNGIITGEMAAGLRRQDVTAIACSNDVIAINLMKTLRKLGIEVPGQVSIIGYDDIPWASVVTPSLTTVRQPFADMGEESVNLLVGRLANPGRRSVRVKLPVSLVVRESTRTTGV